MGGQLETLKKENKVEFDIDLQREEHELDRDFLIEIFSPKWEISWKNYTNSRWQRVLPRVVSCNTGHIVLKNIKAPYILKQVIQIRFDSLLHLQLSNLFLASFEPFIHLRAPLLENLYLGQSGLRNFKSLRKMNAPNLKILQFVHTAIVEADFLNECRFSPAMSSITIFNTATPRTLPENYTFLFKIEPKAIKYFQFYNTRIIRNEPIKEMAKKKYPDCQIKLRFDTID